MEWILAVDIGTSTIRAAMATPADGGLDVLGVGERDSDGMDRGMIVDLDAVAGRISEAVAEAQVKAGAKTRSAIVTGNFGFTSGFNGQGSSPVTGGRRGVTQDDIGKALSRAREKKVPEDMKIVQTITRGFRVDDVTGIQEPLGLAGHLLEVDAHLMALKQMSIENLNRCMQRAGLVVSEILPSPVAQGIAAVSKEEKENGIALIDIGGGTTNIAVYFNGCLQHTASLPVGGGHFTRDLARAFATSLDVAESLKQHEASAFERPDRAGEDVTVPRLPPRDPAIVSRALLDYVVGARAEQIFNEFMRILREKRSTNLLFGGVILTGGTARLEGLPERIEKQLGLDARVGTPSDPRLRTESLRGPEHAALAGTLLHAAERRAERRRLLGTGWRAAARSVGMFAARCFAQFV